MTLDRAQIDRAAFEAIATAAAREDVTLEFINGRIGVKPVPEGGRYRSAVTHSYGHEVVILGPVSVTLDTEVLRDYVR
ncbi:hypothetical protein AB0K43_05820 [Kitasatospora sp. NPDC049258]|uniref:hypothetical protein n=1 Tax=Kitasatospora sp. NPDC049258 TaxID=3155394 RepID=UPI0034437BA1